MPGTRQQLVSGVIAVVLAAPAAALAYHNGKVYDLAPGAGGAGGLFYTGSTRERGWDCTACHLDPPKRLRVNVTSQPSALIDQLTYQPNAAYTITVALADPPSQLGLQSARSNFNAMVISMLDGAGSEAGAVSGFDPGKFYARGNSILASDSTSINETTWTFTWTAPATSMGPITINLGVVDGNGANSTTVTLTDPLGDDVFMAAYVVTDGAAARAMFWATERASDVLAMVAAWTWPTSR